MVTTVLQRVATLAWDATDGVPELFEAKPETNLRSETPPGQRRAGAEARIGPDGVIDVLALRPDHSRLVRLIDPRSVTELPGGVVAAVSGPDGSTVVLRTGSSGPVVESLSADGAVTWTCDDLPELSNPRLWPGRSGGYLVGDGTLVTVSDGHAEVAAQWTPGGEPVMSVDGRVAFVRWNEADQRRDVVLRQPASGEEIVVPGTDESFGFLARLIGVDNEGRCYGFSAGELGRVTPDGRVDWRLPLATATVEFGGEDVGMRTVTGAFGDPDLRLLPPASGSVTPDGRVVLAVVAEHGVDLLTVRPRAT